MIENDTGCRISDGLFCRSPVMVAFTGESPDMPGNKKAHAAAEIVRLLKQVHGSVSSLPVELFFVS